MAHLTVAPKVSLADEPVRICVSGLEPNQLVTLRAWLVDEKGLLFHSRAFYRTDEGGNVDLERAEATGGNFKGALPMGLLWSLSPEKPFQRLIKRDVIGTPFRITLEVYDTLQLSGRPDVQPLASEMIERWNVAPGIRRIQIREGRVRGALFLPPGDGPFPGVIDLFGGAGGLMEFRSGLLASHGFAALALAYFAYEDLPSDFSQLDLTYFEEAADLLLRHPKVSMKDVYAGDLRLQVLGPGVGVVALCKGAELALAMATYLKQVAATVWINGTNSISGGILNYRDICITGSPYMLENIITSDYGTIDVKGALIDPRAPEHQHCVLPVEQACGKILFVVAGADRIINSRLYADEALARLRRHGKTNGQLLLYPGAGHLIEPPGAPLCTVSQIRDFPFPLMWGGELEAHCRAQEHSWKEIQNFLHCHLGRPSVSKL